MQVVAVLTFQEPQVKGLGEERRFDPERFENFRLGNIYSFSNTSWAFLCKVVTL